MTKYLSALLMFFVAWPSFAADPNGYTAKYECRAGGPVCNVDIAKLTSAACEVTVTTSDTNWSKITSNSSKTVYCIQAGDHTSKGTLTLSFSGTSGTRKILRYYRNDDNNDDPWNQSDANKAKLTHIILNGVSYWVIHRITLDSTNGVYNGRFEFGTGSNNNNIISRILVDNGESARIYITNADNNTIQNSVLRDCAYRVGVNYEGIQINNNTSNTHIVNNETYGCTKGFYLADFLAPGTVVENNDMWVPTSLYTDCNGHYTPNNPNSPCGANKTTFGTKNGGTAGNPILIVHNRIWGARYTDPNVCCADIGTGTLMFIGGNTKGEDPVTEGAKYTLVQNNILMDGQVGIGGYWDGVNHNSFIGNIVYKIHQYKSTYGSWAVGFGEHTASEWYLNTVVDADKWALLSDTYGGYDSDVRCNVIISSGAASGTPRSGTQVENNAFYGTPPFTTSSSIKDVVGSTASDSKNAGFCFYRKLRTGPEKACIPYARSTTASPHRNACDPKTGLSVNIGINDNPLF